MRATRRQGGRYRALERMYVLAPVNLPLNPTIRIGDATAEITMPVSHELFHSGGAMHGSYVFKALDDAAFFASQSLVDDVFILTTSFTCHFVKPVRAGSLVARGRVLNWSRKRCLAEAVATADGVEVAHARVPQFVDSSGADLP